MAEFSELCQHIETGNVEGLLSSETTHKAVECMNNLNTAPIVLEQITELVAMLFTFDYVKKAMGNRPRPIVDALFVCLKNKSEEPRVQQNIFKAIGNLATKDDFSQNWLIDEYDALNVIASILKRSPSLSELHEKGYYALQKLASGCELNIHELFYQHEIHLLAESSMKEYPNHAGLQTQACVLLRRLSLSVALLTPLMAISPLVLHTMRSFPLEAYLNQHCCVFLGNLAYDVDNKKALVQKPYLAYEAVLAAMRLHFLDGAVQEETCSAIWSFSFDDAHNQRLLVQHPYQAHELVLAAMSAHPLHIGVQYEACGALLNLAIHPENKLLFLKCQAHIFIIASLRAHPQNEQLQLEAVWALSNLSNDQSVNAIMVRDGIFEICEKAQRSFPNNAQLLERLLNIENNMRIHVQY